MHLGTTTFEQRHTSYEDVRALLTPGFLVHHVSVNGSRFVLRSLNDDDWFVLRTRTWGASVREWKAWLVSSAIWMVDGQLVLGEGDIAYRLFEMCLHMPETVLDDLDMLVTALMKRVSEAAGGIEGFMYEDESRVMWKSQGGAQPDTYFHGKQVGTNPVRRIWSYFNQIEDTRENNDYMWQLTKFMVSPHAPKGVKKIQATDQKNKGEETRRRQQTMDRIFYESIGAIKKASAEERRKGARGPWQEVRMAESTEELQEVMRRWVEGIKDDHDDVVDGVKSRIKHEVEGRKANALAQQKALRRALDEEGITKSNLIPIAGQAGQEFLDRVRQRMPGTSQVVQDASHNSAYEKYIAKNPEVGNLRVDDEGRVTSTRPADPEMVNMMLRPDAGEDKPSLQEQITARHPTAKFRDDGEGS